MPFTGKMNPTMDGIIREENHVPCPFSDHLSMKFSFNIFHLKIKNFTNTVIIYDAISVELNIFIIHFRKLGFYVSE